MLPTCIKNQHVSSEKRVQCSPHCNTAPHHSQQCKQANCLPDESPIGLQRSCNKNSLATLLARFNSPSITFITHLYSTGFIGLRKKKFTPQSHYFCEVLLHRAAVYTIDTYLVYK
ncbi:hypothetical protein XENOCAPTIV_028138 [Xenoophorus captivus]|uniref:Uncharacterized protein n=1 Tax=Xenoophorus captivus TaxID=1517983 RepID=A0ABV0SBU5_9TELE